MEHRETFSSRWTAIMAMAGSAIGLGNIWRFPYIVGEYGGAAFIIVYLIFTALLSLPIFLSESIIGRRTHLGTCGALEKLAPGTPWKYMGLLTIISALLILSFYSVVGGWSVDYFAKSLTLTFSRSESGEIQHMFQSFIAKPWAPILCHTIFLLLTALIVGFGVKNGIELFSKASFPMLFVLIVFIMCYSFSLPGSGKGVAYLVKPDFSKLDAKALVYAMGQSFFSLSLGVGTILTYSSHIKKKEKLLSSAGGTVIFDLMFAILAGFAVMPAVFAAGITPGAGPGLIFETLPFIFSDMGSDSPWLSATVSITFFLTILVAALTSSISMFETCVAYLVEQRRMKRWTAVVVIFLIIWSMGCLCSLSFGPLNNMRLFGCTIFELCDKVTANFLMIFGGLLFTIFVGWKMSSEEVKEELGGSRLFKPLYFLIKYVAPVFIIVIFVTNLII